MPLIFACLRLAHTLAPDASMPALSSINTKIHHDDKDDNCKDNDKDEDDNDNGPRCLPARFIM